jgi:hypothetical protein
LQFFQPEGGPSLMLIANEKSGAYLTIGGEHGSVGLGVAEPDGHPLITLTGAKGWLVLEDFEMEGTGLRMNSKDGVAIKLSALSGKAALNITDSKGLTVQWPGR